jgi:hypothetical protein
MILGRGRCTPVTGRRGRPSSFLVWATTGQSGLRLRPSGNGVKTRAPLFLRNLVK